MTRASLGDDFEPRTVEQPQRELSADPAEMEQQQRYQRQQQRLLELKATACKLRAQLDETESAVEIDREANAAAAARRQAIQEATRTRFPAEVRAAQQRRVSACAQCAAVARCRPEDVEYHFGLIAEDVEADTPLLDTNLAARARAAVDAARATAADPAVKWAMIVRTLVEFAHIEELEADVAMLHMDAEAKAAAAEVARAGADAAAAEAAERQAAASLERVEVARLECELAALLQATAMAAAETPRAGAAA